MSNFYLFLPGKIQKPIFGVTKLCFNYVGYHHETSPPQRFKNMFFHSSAKQNLIFMLSGRSLGK
jgi:hypothetical protein